VWGESCVEGDGYGADESASDERCRRGFQGPIQMADGRRSWTCRHFPLAPLVSCDRVKLTRLQVLFMMMVLVTGMQTPMSSLHSILAISLLSPPPNSAATARSPTTTRRCSPATTKNPSSSNSQVSLEPTAFRCPPPPTFPTCPSPPRRHAHRSDARIFRPPPHSAPAATSRCRSRSQDDQGRWRVAAVLLLRLFPMVHESSDVSLRFKSSKTLRHAVAALPPSQPAAAARGVCELASVHARLIHSKRSHLLFAAADILLVHTLHFIGSVRHCFTRLYRHPPPPPPNLSAPPPPTVHLWRCTFCTF
jgi:hypothetical protein